MRVILKTWEWSGDEATRYISIKARPNHKDYNIHSYIISFVEDKKLNITPSYEIRQKRRMYCMYVCMVVYMHRLAFIKTIVVA
jgi:hypothetical protein